MQCLVCHQSNIKKHPSSGEKYKLLECSSCGLVFDGSVPKKISAIYSENYYKSQKIKGGYYNYFYESIINKLTFKHRLDKLSKLKEPGKSKLLDVGCALGDFLEVARILQWRQIYGVDISQYAVDVCRQKGLSVLQLDNLKNLKNLEEKNFGLITMQDVLEHLVHPTLNLSSVKNNLKPGGILFLTTPDMGSLSRKLMGKHWYHYKKAEHLYYFNQKNIKMLLESTGFTDIIVQPTLSWVTMQYIINRLKYYSKNIFANPFVNFVSNLPICKIAFPIYTGEMEIIARKPIYEAKK